MKLLYPKENLFFLTLMRETVEYREMNKVERNDFVNLMMQLRDSGRGEEDPENHVELTSNMMAAQVGWRVCLNRPKANVRLAFVMFYSRRQILAHSPTCVLFFTTEQDSDVRSLGSLVSVVAQEPLVRTPYASP